MPDTASSMAPGGSSAPAGQPPQAAETVPGTAPAPNTRRWWFIAACIGLALAARGLLLLHAPDHAFLSDHIEFMAWANWVAERGPTALYDVTAEYLINVRFPPEGGRPPRVAPYPAIDRCNYPPLAGDLLWLQGKLWRWLDPQVQTLQVGPDLARYAEFRGRAATSPVANTLAARGANAAAPIVADFLTAWGVLRLVRALRRQDHDAEPRGTRAENVAFAVALLAPPALLNSAFWTQIDACVTALLIWCVCLLIERRWALAGVCYGLALLTKAQAILLLPALAFIALGLRLRAGGKWTDVAQLGRTALATLLTVAVIAAPYMLFEARRPNGEPFRWLQRAYVYPIREQYPYTTLHAFNMWWLDFVAHGQTPQALDVQSTALGGITKARAGLVAFAAALLSAGLACARWRWAPRAWVAFAGLALLAAFVFPTRVHERYIFYCVPFLVVLAADRLRWTPSLIGVLLVASFEMTWFLWLVPADAAPDESVRSAGAVAWSVVLSLAAMASFAYAIAAVLWRPTGPHGASAPATPNWADYRSSSLFGQRGATGGP